MQVWSREGRHHHLQLGHLPVLPERPSNVRVAKNTEVHFSSLRFTESSGRMSRSTTEEVRITRPKQNNLCCLHHAFPRSKTRVSAVSRPGEELAIWPLRGAGLARSSKAKTPLSLQEHTLSLQNKVLSFLLKSWSSKLLQIWLLTSSHQQPST